MSNCDDTLPVTKIETKRVRENEIIHSDRIDLVVQANRFVESMVNKSVLPKLASGYAPEVDLTADESLTYRAALDFLRRQFEQGYSEAGHIERRVEAEDCTERQPPKEADN